MNEMQTETVVYAEPKEIVTDVVVTADIDIPYYWRVSIEKRVDFLETWVKDFHDFIRDHRSQDPVRLNVERVKGIVCSACGYEWETLDDGSCANCGIPARPKATALTG